MSGTSKGKLASQGLHKLIVLQDGETFSGLDGAYILIVNDAGMDEIEECGEIGDCDRRNVVAEILLRDAFTVQAEADVDE